MLEAIVIICGLLVVGILFYPRRSPYVRRVTRSYNGQHYGKGRELVFDNHNQRQKITKNSVTYDKKQAQDHQKQRHLCTKSSVSQSGEGSLGFATFGESKVENVVSSVDSIASLSTPCRVSCCCSR